nr:retrovirus-related Pol polyprotein from transposon TNT 1-94 [Tanacetum cinerariifolium]
MKFLRSLPSEWNTHVVVWRNKVDLDTMSIDDLYNNFKIVEQEVKRTVASSSSSKSQNMAFLSSPGSTNEVDTASIQVSTISTPVSTVSSHDNTTNLSDATVYDFLANQPNGSQLVHEDLKQIHEDDMEEIDLKWQLALLSMRARRLLRNQESRPRNQDSSRKTVNVEDTSSKAMVTIDGAGFDWSYMADDEVPTNMALGAPQDALKDQGYFDNGCSRHMTGNISYLTKFKEHDGGYVAFRRGAKGGKITRKGTIRSETKDKTGRILKSFITEIENLVGEKVKIIKCDNEKKFKNRVMNEFCEEKCIKREYNIARTPQQNRVAKRRNMTLIEAARTMVLVVKPHFKTPYELFKGRSPALSFMRPFGCHVTILNTLDQLGKFDGKSNEWIIVGNSTISKAFRVYNIRTRKVEENLHITFLKNKPIITVNTATPTYADYPNDPIMPDLKDTGIFDDAYDDRDEGAEADYNNLEIVISVSPIPSTIIHKDHPKEHIIREVNSAVQTRKMAKKNEARLISFINKQRRTNHKDFQNCLFACFLSQMEPKKVYKNKRDQRGIVVKNKARLVAQGHRQEEGVDYDEVFAPVARIEVIRLFLAYASFMDFTVYQMDVNSAFLYGTIKDEIYVSQPSGFVDPEFPDKVYKVEKALYGLHQALRAWYKTLSTYLLDNRFRRGTIDKTLFIKQIKDDILLVQVYVDDIIFGFTERSLSTEFEQLMHKRFQMSSMRELTFFLGLQVKQRKDVIFLIQDKYTKIHVDNVSAICVVKNPVYHLKTKYIEIRHHFIRDSYEKRFIEVALVCLILKAWIKGRLGLKLKGYLINDGYADLVQHASD